MKDRKSRILEVALELFANYGYDATSTSKIAKKADVSEGLIFKHFESKLGVLNALTLTLETKFSALAEKLLSEKDPKQILRIALEQIFNVPESEFNFWTLQYKLKLDKRYYNPETTLPVRNHLTFAFKTLKYSSPENEAFLFYEIIDGTFMSMIRGDVKDPEDLKQFLYAKYELN